MLFFSSINKKPIQIEFESLSSQPREIKEKACSWFHQAWAKDREDGLEYSEKQIRRNKRYIHIIFFNNEAVGMFVLKPYFDKGFNL